MPSKMKTLLTSVHPAKTEQLQIDKLLSILDCLRWDRHPPPGLLWRRVKKEFLIRILLVARAAKFRTNLCQYFCWFWDLNFKWKVGSTDINTAMMIRGRSCSIMVGSLLNPLFVLIFLCAVSWVCSVTYSFLSVFFASLLYLCTWVCTDIDYKVVLYFCFLWLKHAYRLSIFEICTRARVCVCVCVCVCARACVHQ